ncbi:amidohydrolase family protein [Pseudomonas sp. DWP3-1-2]|jgi:predicted TIM-barrel fold metal-dependent hydrolase|uniref:amidohydrolase family protein n=1 Tax=Pseudomonas sp. DWP3-1-2 TaxID=2804645 RepID=UPI003CF8CB7D
MTQPIFDAHCHIIDPRFPLKANNGYMPEPFLVADYQALTGPLGVVGGAVVSGSFQGFDQGYLLEALRRLGSGFVGVTQVPANITNAELETLNGFGVRALRFNLKRGGSEQLDQLDALARRVFEQVGWHTELYVDSSELPELEHLLLQLPKVSIDHLGLSPEGLPTLLRLAERGVHIKASGFGRVGFPVSIVLKAIFAANPQALMFGTDLPSTRAPRPFRTSDIDLIKETLGERDAQLVLWENASTFYRARFV